METLEQFDFDKRPSRSRYAAAVDALVNGVDGKPIAAVKLVRGDDFPEGLKIESVQGSISTQVRHAGKHARTRKVDDDTLVVGLYTEDAPRRRRRSANGTQKAAATA